MNRLKPLFLWLFLLFVLIGGAVWLVMDKPHQDIGAQPAQFKMVPEELSAALSEAGETGGDWIGAVVELFAVVEQDDGTRVIMKGGVVATWDTTRSHRTLEEGELLRLKGRVTGYDDLFGEVRMDGLVMVEP